MIEGKNAIITGARTGIGLATVEKFASSAVNVWAIVHREDSDFLKKIKFLSEHYGVWIHPVYIDLSDEKSISTGIKNIISEKLPIDILVNAAGVVSPNRLIQMTSLSDMRHVMEVNFFAAIQISQMISRIMCKQRRGSIVNIASIAGIDGDLAQLEYAASKAALICATKKMAYEWGHYNIRVNAIAPGLIDTKMLSGMGDYVENEMISKNPFHRKGKPEEVANLCLYLSSDESTYISGQVIRIDGGGTSFVSNKNN